MRVALVSLNQRWHDKDANFARSAELVREARTHGAELAIFPEMTLTGYSTEVAAIAEPEEDSPTLERFGALADETGVAIIFGACLVEGASGRARNQLCLAVPGAGARAAYAKVHPFSYAGEDAVLQAGDRLAVLDIGPLQLGASICYDLRFPELYAVLAPASNAAVSIANWPRGRAAHWRALLVARAIENQFHMFGVNRIGTDGNGLAYEKGSLAVAPNGEVLAPVVAGEELDVYDVDPTAAAAYRAAFPTLRDKRYDLYRELAGAS